MLRRVLLAAAMVAACALPASAVTTLEGQTWPGRWLRPPTKDDRDFAKAMISSDLFEQKAAQLALQRSQSSDIRQIAQQLLREEQTVDPVVRRYAQIAHADIPDQPVRHEGIWLAELQNAPAQRFDADWLAVQAASHGEDLRELQSEELFAVNWDGRVVGHELIPTLVDGNDAVLAALNRRGLQAP